MKDFTGRVAVVTGAASGIGRALAQHCAHEGMKVVLADIEAQALAVVEQTMKADHATVLAVPTDVSQAESVEALARQALDVFGGVHLLFNNAGVFCVRSMWESTLNDWQWVLGVNLWGVIHGVRSFVPMMLQEDTECHIVNTASAAGLISGGLGVYTVSKHAVVALSETLYHELRQQEAKVGVSVLCPGLVKTRIFEAARNRPEDLLNDTNVITAQEEAVRQVVEQSFELGMSPEQVAETVFDAVRNNQFYIVTHPETQLEVKARMEDILLRRNPTTVFG